MKFTLQSKFSPTGDQPEAIAKLAKGVEKKYRDQTMLGVTGSGKTFVMANIVEKIQKPTLVIVHNKTLAAQLASEFREFFPKNAVQYFVSYYDYYQPESYLPRTDTYIAKETEVNDEIDRLRNAATMSLLTRKDVLIVASVSCIYGLGNPNVYDKIKVGLKKGEKYERQKLLHRLNNIQYARNDTDFARGTYRVRGDILEIHPAYADTALKFSFFGDELEKISEVDPLTGEILEEPESVEIFPASHYATSEEQSKLIIPAVKQELKQCLAEFKKQNKLLEAERLSQRTNYDLEILEQTGHVSGIENYSRYLDGREAGQPPFTLIDYFPEDFLLFIDESHMTVPQIGGMYKGDRSRKETLVEHGFRLPSALDNRPLRFAEFEKKINQVIYVSATPGDYERKQSKQVVEQIIRPTGLTDPEIEIRPTKNQIDDLINEIQKRVQKKQRALVTTLTKRMAEDLAQYLKEAGIKVHYLHSEVDTLERLEILRDLRLGVYDVVVGVNLLREGLDLPEVTLVAILDADKEGFLRSETALIQVMGRAARHVEGRVIMYADEITGSMDRATCETTRRRKIQATYNKKHNITPRTIKKKISEERLAGGKTTDVGVGESEPRLSDIPPDELKRIVKELEAKMNLAAKNLEFEKAADIRDQISKLKKSNKGV